MYEPKMHEKTKRINIYLPAVDIVNYTLHERVSYHYDRIQFLFVLNSNIFSINHVELLNSCSKCSSFGLTLNALTHYYKNC